MLKLLVDKGATLESELLSGTNFLYGTHNFQIFKYMLNKGAIFKAIDKQGNTLLHSLCQ